MRPMSTNGGTHPADKWADITADAICDLIQVKEDSVSEEATQARAIKRELKPKIFDICNGHHADLQSAEKNAPLAPGEPMDILTEVTATLDLINELLKQTPFAAHFEQEHVQKILFNIIGQHSADIVHIERLHAVSSKAS